MTAALAALTGSRSFSLPSPLLAQQVPGETSPAVLPGISSLRALAGQKSLFCLRCPGAAFLLATGAACSSPYLGLERLITNRCWFMCCWLSCLPSRQMCCRDRALSRWDFCPSCGMWTTDYILYIDLIFRKLFFLTLGSILKLVSFI